MVGTPIRSTTDTWIRATWDEYQQAIVEPDNTKATGYYYDGHMRLEMSPRGNPHSRDHFIILVAIALYASLKNIDLDGHDNCTYCKTGVREAQPDASFYINDAASTVPWDATIINLDAYPAPDLVVEIAHSSLQDDQGPKRLLYEELGV
ncbi:MAG: Uma2 family endonuclease, partial [Cyanobacteria bacterium P01_H01_bin.58]